MSPALVEALAGPVVEWSVRVESWYGGELLSRSVPVAGSQGITWTDGQIESALGFLSVPVGRERRDHRHPVGAYGQRLRPVIEVTTVAGQVESVPLGFYTIERAPVADGIADVEVRDMGRVIERARSVTPSQPVFEPGNSAVGSPAVSVAQMVSFVMNGVVPWKMVDDFGMATRTTHMPRDRYRWLADVLTAYGALGRFDASGALVISRASRRENQQPVGRISDGVGGTLVDLQPDSNASAGFNACIVQGVGLDGGPVFGGAYVKDGPMAWPVQVNAVNTSPYGARPGFFYSPLLSTSDECKTAARTRLSTWMDGASGTFTVECGPDPRWEVGDVLELVQGDAAPVVARVKSVTLPLVPDAGPMRIGGVLL